MTALAVAYLFGVTLGTFAAWGLPWWLSGVTGWLLLFAAQYFGRLVDPHGLYDPRTRDAVAWGSAFGAWSGASAAEVPEVLGALVWPGHETDGVFAAFLVALAWLIGCIISRDDEPDRSLRVGLALYALTLALSYGPPLWEVW